MGKSHWDNTVVKKVGNEKRREAGRMQERREGRGGGVEERSRKTGRKRGRKRKGCGGGKQKECKKRGRKGKKGGGAARM